MLQFLILIFASSIAVISFSLVGHSTASIINSILLLNYANDIVYSVNPLLYIALNPSVFLCCFLLDSILIFRRFRKCFLQMFKRKATLQVTKSKIKPFCITRNIHLNNATNNCAKTSSITTANTNKLKN